MTSAIITKRIEASKTMPVRYKASSPAGAVFVKVGDYDGNETEAARQAVLRLLARFRMSGTYYAGTLPDGRTVWVQPNAVQVHVKE